MTNTELKDKRKIRDWKNRFFDISLDMLSVAGFDGYFKYVNKRWEKKLGWSEKELMSRPYLQFVHPDDRDHTKEAWDKLKRGNPVIEFKNRLLCRDGSHRTVSWNSTSVKKDELIFSVTRDITERRQAEKAREQSEVRYKTLFESANDAIFVMDREKFIDCNPKTLEIFECTRDQIIGQQPYDFSPTLQPDGRDSKEKALEKIELAMKGQPQFFLWKHTRYNGAPFDAEVSLNAVNLKSGSYILAVVRDVTRRELALKGLRESEQRFRTLFESIRDIYFVTTLEWKIIEISPSLRDVLKYSRDELLGERMTDFYSESGVGEAILKQLRKTGKVESYEILLNDREGNVHVAELNAVLSGSGVGELQKIVGVIRDKTEKKKLEEQLIQSQKMEAIGTLAAGIAHDFNNLLTTIMTGADFVLAHLDKDSEIYSMLENIRNAGQKASGLTSQLLTFGRKQVFEPRVANINDIIHDLEKMIQRIIREDIELKTVLKSKNGIIKADMTQIEQVLVNLIVNAQDAMPSGGKLTIRTEDVIIGEEYPEKQLVERPGRYVLITVSDTGTGMREGVVRKIFDPFFTTKVARGGSGLGLSVVYGIVKQHGGYIVPYSRKGEGTTFKIFFPVVEKGRDVEKRGKDGKVDLTGNETILLVEDDDNVRMLMERSLNRLGYNVISSGNVNGALEIVSMKWEQLDLLITDVIMPDMNGKELYRRMMEEHDGKIKVLFMSGYHDEIINSGEFDGEQVDFIQKPFITEELGRKIRKLLDS